MKRIPQIFLLALSITIVYGVILFFVIKESRECDEHVILNDGKEYDCRHVSSFSNGMSCIRLCGEGEINVPTNRIIEVRKK